MSVKNFVLECEKENKELSKELKYFKNKSQRLEQKIKKYEEIIVKSIKFIEKYKKSWDFEDEVIFEMNLLLKILKGELK